MISFASEPYYDDFDETKNFHKILFKPGYAVQARELTQLQSIIQNQIDRFGSHIFKNGSKVHDGEHTALYTHTIAIKSFVGTSDISWFIDKHVIINDIKKLVVHATSIDNEHNLYVVDASAGDIPENSTLTVLDHSTYSLLTESSSVRAVYIKSTLHSIATGVYFIHGAFVMVNAHTILTSATNHTYSYDVHLVAYESIVTSSTDESLLDNAYQSPNYAAPGADRYAIELKLEYSYPDTTISNVNKSFLLASYRNGKLIADVSKPIYSDLELHLAKKTFDESGNYTVVPFIGRLTEHVTDDAKFSIILDPGTAYVNGFEASTLSPITIDFDKARTTSIVNNSQIAINKGPYILVENLNTMISPYSSMTIDIHDTISPSTSASTYNNTVIGSATISGIEFDSLNTGASYTYKMFITDVIMKSTKVISGARSFVVKTGSSTYSWTFFAQYNTETYDTVNILGATVTDVKIQNSQAYTQLLSLNNSPVKTHINPVTDMTDISYSFYSEFKDTQFTRSGSTSSATIAVTGNKFFIGGGILPQSTVLANWYAKVKSVGTGTGTAPVVGSIMKLDLGVVNVVSDNSATITIPYDYNVVLDIFVVVGSSTSAHRNKIINVNSTIVIPLADVDKISISLLKADGISLSSIIDNDGNNHISKYIFSSGQNDIYYDHARILLANPNVTPKKSNPNIKYMTVTFSYYSHAGQGPITVDSYYGLMTYDKIPMYRTTAGAILHLSDVIDFRPRRMDDQQSLVFDAYQKPKFGSNLITDYEYYLPRIDRLLVSGNSREFIVTKGHPSKFPIVPPSSDGMTIYMVTIPAYTFKTSDIMLEYIDNKRYTMRDIAKIDTRVNRLEYYTALSLLEKQASDESIPSQTTGIDKFKNGILVDSFAGHSVGDVFNPYYICSIDYNSRYLRPSFISNSFDYIYDDAASSNIQLSNDLITLEYDEVAVLSQVQASEYESVIPFSSFNWNGIINLDPPADIWTDTTIKPINIVNQNGEFDHLTQGAQGDVWSDWQTTGVGITDLALQANVSVKSGVSVI